jgi:hypothetical protein
MVNADQPEVAKSGETMSDFVHLCSRFCNLSPQSDSLSARESLGNASLSPHFPLKDLP